MTDIETDDTTGGPTPYDMLGGATPVRELVDRFYDLMDLDAEFATIRAMHPASLDGSRDKLYWFLSGWLGGPGLYIEKVGHPMLRARHLPFPIGGVERDQWLTCMALAMRDCGVGEPLFDKLLESFIGTADWMRNKQD